MMHVDLDESSLAAVEVGRRPELRGLPVVGGNGDPTERGVVAIASYAVREHGVHSGMPPWNHGPPLPRGGDVPPAESVSGR